MKQLKITMKEISEINFPQKNILIIGHPASGKTSLALLLKQENHTVFHSDDYQKHGFKESLYELMKDLERTEGGVIVEGILGYRLLRKGLETGKYFPDVVIEIVVDAQTIEERYRKERDPSKLKGVFSLCKSCEKVLRDYKLMPNENIPDWIRVRSQDGKFEII